MRQNGDTLTSQASRRNLWRVFVRLLSIFLLAIPSFELHLAWAQSDAFQVPLKSLSKIDPAHVVQFRLVETTTSGSSGTAQLELQTRGGFKIYDHGLRFEYRSAATLDALVPLKAVAQPSAKVIQDPFYNEPRAVHEPGALFTLTSELPIDETGVIRIRFEACSVNTCLLPAYFLVQAKKGSTSQPEPKSNRLPGVNPTPSQKKSVEPTPTPTAFPSVAPAAANEPSLTDSLTAEVQRSILARSWLLFPALFLAGLLMNLTPCVYPMIPITLNVLGQSHSNNANGQPAGTRASTLTPALIYVLGIVLSYAAMGVVAGMTGSLFGGLLQSKVVNGILAALMFTFGLSMLDVFDLSKIQAAAHRIPLSRKSPHLTVLTMGAVSGLVAAPCTGPVLSMLLLLVGQTKDPIYGFTLMSVFAAGFGSPYLLLGLVSQQIKRLPKAGLLMTLVKNIFAALMFSLALYYLKTLVQQWNIFALLYMKPPLIGVLTIVVLTLIFLVLQVRKPTSPLSKIGLQIGLTLLSLWLALSLVKGFVAADVSAFPSFNRINDPLKVPQTPQQPSDGVIWMKNWNEAVRAAQEQKKGLVVDAWAEWCAACLKMDAEVWNEPGVVALIQQHFIALKVDFTESNPQADELRNRWDLAGLPAVGIYPVGSDFSSQPAVLFREAVTVSTFHQAVQKIFNSE